MPHAGLDIFDKIKGWYDCGRVLFPSESPPDIHPTPEGWNVSLSASQGDTYLGMVVRDNESWESLSQRIRVPFNKSTCYEFTVDLARSDRYISKSHVTQRFDNYITPAVLRIWGGNSYCSKAELLAETDPVEGEVWHQESFKVEPSGNYYYITIEAFYKTPTLFAYNGHILIDNISEFRIIPCHEEATLAKKEEEPQKTNTPVETEKLKPPKVDKREATPSSRILEASQGSPEQLTNERYIEDKEERLLVELNREMMEKDQTILVKNLFFEADKDMIKEESFAVLNEIYNFLQDNSDIVIEIAGHTNGNHGITNEYCDMLSTKRAKTVAEYLVEHGIASNRVYYKGYGKRKPIDTNLTAEGRLRNQRVEIRIISMND